jgi:hypothetical protein
MRGRMGKIAGERPARSACDGRPTNENVGRKVRGVVMGESDGQRMGCQVNGHERRGMRGDAGAGGHRGKGGKGGGKEEAGIGCRKGEGSCVCGGASLITRMAAGAGDGGTGAGPFCVGGWEIQLGWVGSPRSEIPRIFPPHGRGGHGGARRDTEGSRVTSNDGEPHRGRASGMEGQRGG